MKTEKRLKIERRNRRLQLLWAVLYVIFTIIISYSFYTWKWYAGLIVLIGFIAFAAYNYGWIRTR